MIPDFITTELKLFWLFFAFLSLLPMILAVWTQKADEKNRAGKVEKEEKKTT